MQDGEELRSAFRRDGLHQFIEEDQVESALEETGNARIQDDQFEARRISGRLKNAELKVAEGKVRLDQHYNSSAAFTSHYVYVGGKKFGFTEDMSRAFKEGEKYRVYYCMAGAYELIVSYERMA